MVLLENGTMEETNFYPEPTKNKFLVNNTVSVIPVPFSGGQGKRGVELGPIELEKFGLIDQLKKLGYNVTREGTNDVDYMSKKPEFDGESELLKNPIWVSNTCKDVAERVQSACAKGKFALTLGGDHSIAVGTIAGTTAVYGDDLCVVWVDAHADINTVESSSSGNIHGMPLSYILGISGDNKYFEWIKPILKKNRLVYIGLRDVDDGEKQILRKHNIRAFSMHEVDKYGISKVVEMALDYVNPNRDLPIHLSYDVDAMDPSVVQATGTPVRGGLTFREGHYLCEELALTGCLVAMDLVEVNPLLGDTNSAELSVAIGCSLVRCTLGETLL